MVSLPHVPRIALGTFPTPVERMDALCTDKTALYVKHDDASGALYGGNKVRKLEPILASARDRGKKRLLTIGASGSHHVLATTIYGRRHGFAVAAVLVPQPRTPHAEHNLRIALGEGLEPFPAGSYAAVPLRVLSAMGADTAFVALGGSSVAGTMGYVFAGLELAEQVARGELPEPDVVVTALGSGGTAAGLAVGLEAAGLRTKVLGVAVSSPVPMFGAMARRLVKRVAHRIPGLHAPSAAARIVVSGSEVGEGYGFATESGRRATEVAKASAGLDLDPTYTAKAFACALEEVARGEHRTIVFLHTLSSVSLAGRLGTAPPLPQALAPLFV